MKLFYIVHIVIRGRLYSVAQFGAIYDAVRGSRSRDGRFNCHCFIAVHWPDASCSYPGAFIAKKYRLVRCKNWDSNGS